MSRLVIHPGFVKSASTGLQVNLFDRHPEIANIGKPYNDESRLDVHDFVDYVCLTPAMDYDPRRAAESYAAVIAPRISDDKVTVLSDERVTTTAGIDRSLVAARIRDLFGEAKVVFAIRRQIDVLSSIYMMHYLEGNHSVTFDQWAEMQLRAFRNNSIVAMVNYHRLIEYYVRQFGRENVSVFLYERLVENAVDFVAELCAAIGIASAADAPLARGQRIRQRGSRFEYLRRNHPSLTLVRDAARRALPAGAYERLKALTGGTRRVEVRMSDATRKAIEDTVRDGNRALQESFGLPLEAYGYPL